jgi:hypothetical protein
MWVFRADVLTTDGAQLRLSLQSPTSAQQPGRRLQGTDAAQATPRRGVETYFANPATVDRTNRAQCENFILPKPAREPCYLAKEPRVIEQSKG